MAEEATTTIESLNAGHLLWATVIWPLIFIPVCFILFYIYHADEQYVVSGVTQIATISLSGAFGFSEILLTYGLHLEGFLLFFSFVTIFIVTESALHTQASAIGVVC